MRYAATACVVAGGLLVGGSTGGVALAKPDDPSKPGDDGSGAPGKPDTNPPGRSRNHWPMYKTPTAGPVSLPKLNLPSLGPFTLPAIGTLPRLGPITLPSLGTSQWAPITLPGANSLPGLPIPTLSTGTTEAGDGPPLDAPAPTVDVVPPATPPGIWLFPPLPGDHAGPPIVIKNPLPDTLPINLDQPIVPQLLPPPIVSILAAASQQIPLIDLVMTPLLDDFVLPPLLSDIIVPALLSDVIVPTISLSSFFPGTTVPAMSAPNDRAVASAMPSVAPPIELAPTGMDLPQGPLTSPSPMPSAPVVDSPRQSPQPANPPNDGVAALSEPVAFRAGYSDYLRNAGMAQITSIALPGVVGILLVTLGGGFIGYRQARAGHIIRADGIGRFLR